MAVRPSFRHPGVAVGWSHSALRDKVSAAKLWNHIPRHSPGFLETIGSMRRDLVHAARSLVKDRGFAVVCVISLGIGMGGFIALTTIGRAIMAPARGIDTTGLTDLLVLPVGPLRAKDGEWALEQGSYPDYQALRDSDTGMAITGWSSGFMSLGRDLQRATRDRHEWSRFTFRPMTDHIWVDLARSLKSIRTLET